MLIWGRVSIFFSCERTELLIGITNLLWDASWYFMAKQSKNLLSDKPAIIGSCTTLVFSSQSGHRSSPAQSHGIRSMNLWMEQQLWMDSSMKHLIYPCYPMFTIGFWIPQHFDYSKKICNRNWAEGPLSAESRLSCQVHSNMEKFNQNATGGWPRKWDSPQKRATTTNKNQSELTKLRKKLIQINQDVFKVDSKETPEKPSQEFYHNGRLTFGETAGALDVATTAAAVLPKSVLPSSDEPPWDHGQFCKSAGTMDKNTIHIEIIEIIKWDSDGSVKYPLSLSMFYDDVCLICLIQNGIMFNLIHQMDWIFGMGQNWTPEKR